MDSFNGSLMDNQTETFLRKVSILTLTSFNLLGVLENLFILLVVLRTKAFSRMTSLIIFNNVIADVGFDIVTPLMSTSYLARVPWMLSAFDKMIVVTCILAFGSESSHSMMSTSVMVYMFVCNQASRTFITIRKVMFFLCLTWIWNIGLSALHYQADGYYTIDRSRVKVVYNQTTWWFGCLVVTNATVLPITVSCFCFYKIKTHCKEVAQMTASFRGFHKTLKMLALARMNIVCFGFFMASWISVLVVQAVQLPQGFSAFMTLFVCAYRIAKPVIYLGIYPPFRKTAKMMFCPRGTNPPRESGIDVSSFCKTQCSVKQLPVQK